MSEAYRIFDASDYAQEGERAEDLIMAATEEDFGDGAVIRAAIKHFANSQDVSALARDTRPKD